VAYFKAFSSYTGQSKRQHPQNSWLIRASFTVATAANIAQQTHLHSTTVYSRAIGIAVSCFIPQPLPLFSPAQIKSYEKIFNLQFTCNATRPQQELQTSGSQTFMCVILYQQTVCDPRSYHANGSSQRYLLKMH
jgi:hypothetical protein